MTERDWIAGDRVRTMDGRWGYVVEVRSPETSVVSAWPVRVELNGEIGVFAFAPAELTRLDEEPSPRQEGLRMTDAPKYSVYQDTEQWIPFFNWFWIRPGETGMGHGPFPTKWIATLSAWWRNR